MAILRGNKEAAWTRTPGPFGTERFGYADGPFGVELIMRNSVEDGAYEEARVYLSTHGVGSDPDELRELAGFLREMADVVDPDKQQEDADG